MKVIQVHNRYRIRGGEDAVVEVTVDLLKRRGIEASLMDKASRDLDQGLLQKLRASVSGIYSVTARREMAQTLRDERPDLVHVHNLYPLLSPSVLVACRQAGVPVVMTCHNYRLVCPIGVHFRNGKICERCAGGREYWCLFRNCRDNRAESAAYALRNAITRIFGLFTKNITCFISISEFLKQRLIEAGIEEERIAVVPNMIAIAESATDPSQGAYVGLSGRASVEKGISTLLEAAGRIPEIPVQLATFGPLAEELKKGAPQNAEFTGQLTADQLAAFYRNARCLVVPSVWFETFGLVAAEAMSHGLPVIASRIGGLAGLIEDGVTGFLFEPGDPEDLAQKIRRLWEDPDLCLRMGQAGRERAIREYGEETHFKRLMAAYDQALALHNGHSEMPATDN